MPSKLDPEMVVEMEVVLLECQSICERMENLNTDLIALGLLELNNLMRWYTGQIRERLPFGLLKNKETL